MEVNAELYEFLRENETGMFTKNGDIVTYVHIDFSDIDDFITIVGSYYFDEGGAHTRLFEGSLCIELDDIFEGAGHSALNYKNCFDEDVVKRYEKELSELAWSRVKP